MPVAVESHYGVAEEAMRAAAAGLVRASAGAGLKISRHRQRIGLEIAASLDGLHRGAAGPAALGRLPRPLAMALGRRPASAGPPLRGATAVNLDYGLISNVEVLQKVVDTWAARACKAYLDMRLL